jgi:single-strand DNA-binding protein
MSLSINKVMIAGNLTRDPQTRFLANDRAVADFSIACNRRYRTSDGEQKEEVTFIDVEAWGRTAELVGQYLTKGRACFVEGRLRLDTWEDKSGQKRNRLKVVADNVQFIGGRGEGSNRDGAPASDSTAGTSEEPPVARPAPAVDEDDPPF